MNAYKFKKIIRYVILILLLWPITLYMLFPLAMSGLGGSYDQSFLITILSLVSVSCYVSLWGIAQGKALVFKNQEWLFWILCVSFLIYVVYFFLFLY